MALTSPAIVDGWVCAPYDGPDEALVEIVTGQAAAAAYLDWVDDTRVAKVRPAALGLNPGQPVTLALHVNGAPVWSGRLG